MVVAVEVTKESPTSPAANMAASFTRTPREICVVMFSSTTIALSTTMPTAMESAERLIMLMVHPMKYMKQKAMISEKGMVRAITSEERMLRRKK